MRVGLHDAAIAADGEGREGGRALQVRAPDGAVVQIDERDRELYT